MTIRFKIKYSDGKILEKKAVINLISNGKILASISSNSEGFFEFEKQNDDNNKILIQISDKISKISDKLL